MKNKLLSGKSRVILMLVCFVAILTLVGWLMRGKMQTLLHNHIERQVAGQAATMAELVNEKLITFDIIESEKGPQAANVNIVK